MESADQNGVRKIPVYMVTGKEAIKAYKRRLQENKENIPPLVREEAFHQATEYVTKKDSQSRVDQKEGHTAA